MDQFPSARGPYSIRPANLTTTCAWEMSSAIFLSMCHYEVPGVGARFTGGILGEHRPEHRAPACYCSDMPTIRTSGGGCSILRRFQRVIVANTLLRDRP